MKVNVIGKREVSFNDEKTGKDVEGLSVFYTYPLRIDGFGFACEKKFLKGVDSSAIEIDTEYDFDFDSKGRLVDFCEV